MSYCTACAREYLIPPNHLEPIQIWFKCGSALKQCYKICEPCLNDQLGVAYHMCVQCDRIVELMDARQCKECGEYTCTCCFDTHLDEHDMARGLDYHKPQMHDWQKEGARS